MNKELVEKKTKEILDEIKERAEIYPKKEQALKELADKYKRVITEHVKVVSKLKLFDENVNQIKNTVIKILDKKYMPRMKKPKPDLTEEQMAEKKEKAKLKREQQKSEKEEGIIRKRERKEKNDKLFQIPILVEFD